MSTKFTFGLIGWILCLNLNLAADFPEPHIGYEIIQDKSSSFYPECDTESTLKLRLKNGLEVYLVSDPDAPQSSVALSVEAGSWNDPSSSPGMAHFVEHLLFMGSKKYPKESDFFNYVGERGGEYNAFTYHDRTVFGFCLNHKGLEGALDRFSHFFIDPLFSASMVQREKNAIHHEFEDHIESDSIRAWRILKETGNPLHPNVLFSCGNLQSLAEVSPSDIKEWYSKHYVAPRMHLVILSSMPLNKLSQMVVKYFSAVSEKQRDNDSYDFPFTSDRQKGHFIYLAPTHKHRSLQLIWEVPEEFAQKPEILQLVQLALGHEGDLTFAEDLEGSNLAHRVVIDSWNVEKKHALFLIGVDLTKKGVKHIDEVIYRCFQAINALKEGGIAASLHELLHENEKEHFTGHLLQDSFDFVMSVAGSLIDQDIATFQEEMPISFGCSEAPLERFLTSLVPENCLFFVTAPPQEAEVQMNAMEKWMKTPYTIRDIPKEKLDEWKMAPACSRIELGSLEESETLEKMEEEWYEKASCAEKETILINPYVTLSLSHASDLSDSDITIFFQIHNHLSKHSVKNALLSSLFIRELQEHLCQLFPEEDKKSFSYTLVPSERKIDLTLKIFGQGKLEKLQTFFSALTSMEPDRDRFEKIKTLFLDEYPGDPEPVEYAQSIIESLFMPSVFAFGDAYEAFSLISYDEYAMFVQKFFDSVTLEGAFYGNLTADEVSSYWQVIEPLLNKTGEARSAIFENEKRMDWKEALLLEQQTHRKGNALVLVLDIGEVNRENFATHNIFSQILQEEFFEELRIKQQTAYRLYSWKEIFQSRVLQYLTIQSSTHHPRDLLLRTEEFLTQFSENFSKLVSKKRVNLVRRMLMADLIKRLKQSRGSSRKNKKIFEMIETLKALTYEDVCKAVHEAFTQENRKRIAVLIKGESDNEIAEPPLDKLSSYSIIQR